MYIVYIAIYSNIYSNIDIVIRTLFDGSLSSPDMFAPAMIPVTPLNNTPNTVAKETSVPSVEV
jgi:hypothetical protein